MILLQNILHKGSPAHILIDGGRIARISTTPIDVPDAEKVDCSGKAVIPGFVNMHTHAAMIMLRGIHEDLILYDWLNHIWKIEAKLDRDFIYWGTKLACLEMIKSGTTTFNDQYWHCPHACRAAMEMGLRPVISFIFLDSYNHELMMRQREACERLYRRTLDWEAAELSESQQRYAATDDAEIKACVEQLLRTDAGLGFIHESFHKDDAANFTRPWFAWQNTLFGELILKLVADGKLDVLNSVKAR